MDTARLDKKSAELLRQAGGVVKGYVPRAEPGGKVSLVPWHESTRVNRRKGDGTETPNQWNAKVFIQNIPVPESVQRAMLGGLPPVIRREARERYDALVKRLLADMQKIKALTGRYIPPASIAKEIQEASWKFGDPTLLKRIENVEPAAVEVYASYLMLDAAGRQKEKDSKKVVRDFHGHYNA